MMNTENICMGCLSPLHEGQDTCGICGRNVDAQNDPTCLPIRTLLADRYLVGAVEHIGGDRISYIGMDVHSKTPCQIHEFFPDTLCERDADGSVKVLGGCEHTYEEYRNKFRVHARTLARMRDVAILFPTYDIFDDHNTSYVITEAEEGVSLETRLAELGGRLRWDEARPLFIPLLAGLRTLHSARIYHFGICPENLILGKDGRLRLRGFLLPQARAVSADLKPDLPTGYAAPEQYGFDADLDARTDVYGLTATLFRVLTGNAAPDASTRSSGGNDLFVPAAVAEELPDHVAVCLFKGLLVSPDKRTATIEALQESLTTSATVATLRNENVTKDEESDEPEEAPKKGRGKWVALIAVGVFLLLLLSGGFIVFTLFPEFFQTPEESSAPESIAESSEDNSEESSQEDESSYIEYNPLASVPDVRFQNYYLMAEETLEGNMKLAIEYLVYSDNFAGTILSQEPGPNTIAEEGTVIRVVVSLGKEEVIIPDLAGWTEEHARLYLQALGLRVGASVDRLISDQPYGTVDSTDYEVGSIVKPGTIVSLYISKQKPVEEESSTPADEVSSTPADEESSDSVDESSSAPDTSAE